MAKALNQLRLRRSWEPLAKLQGSLANLIELTPCALTQIRRIAVDGEIPRNCLYMTCLTPERAAWAYRMFSGVAGVASARTSCAFRSIKLFLPVKLHREADTPHQVRVTGDPNERYRSTS